jgi:CspA family cold shock protein
MSQEETGTVKWFDARKGYGFIARENGSDIFVHANNISDPFGRSLEDGERVRFVVGQGPKGPSAEEVTRVS